MTETIVSSQPPSLFNVRPRGAHPVPRDEGKECRRGALYNTPTRLTNPLWLTQSDPWLRDCQPSDTLLIALEVRLRGHLMQCDGSEQVDRLVNAISTGERSANQRRIVAIAGPPASGKSTLAERLFTALEARQPGVSAIMPMDGYHMDNEVLSARRWLPRKGAPYTFDVDGLERDLHRVRAANSTVLIPVFDRALDLARASAREIGPNVNLILLEGNYLLLEEAPWSRMRPLFDITVFLDVDQFTLERRLVERWRHYGHDEDQARARALENDLPNARLVVHNSVPADITIKSS